MQTVALVLALGAVACAVATGEPGTWVSALMILFAALAALFDSDVQR
jgi:hypothetical protein